MKQVIRSWLATVKLTLKRDQLGYKLAFRVRRMFFQYLKELFQAQSIKTANLSRILAKKAFQGFRYYVIACKAQSEKMQSIKAGTVRRVFQCMKPVLSLSRKRRERKAKELFIFFAYDLHRKFLILWRVEQKKATILRKMVFKTRRNVFRTLNSLLQHVMWHRQATERWKFAFTVLARAHYQKLRLFFELKKSEFAPRMIDHYSLEVAEAKNRFNSILLKLSKTPIEFSSGQKLTWNSSARKEDERDVLIHQMEQKYSYLKKEGPSLSAKDKERLKEEISLLVMRINAL